MRRRNFIETVFVGIAGVLLWPARKVRAWRARILVNGNPVPNGSLVQVGENRWHGELDGRLVGPGDVLSVEFKPVRVPAHVIVSVTL